LPAEDRPSFRCKSGSERRRAVRHASSQPSQPDAGPGIDGAVVGAHPGATAESTTPQDTAIAVARKRAPTRSNAVPSRISAARPATFL
jgi:hypothetical protein